jgi:hypothetical protein
MAQVDRGVAVSVRGDRILEASLKDLETKMFIQQFEAVDQYRCQNNRGQGCKRKAKFMNEIREEEKHRQGWQDEVQG